MKKTASEESAQQSYSLSQRLRTVASGLENLTEGKKINGKEQEAFIWGALFLETLYNPRVQKDQEVSSLIRTYAGAFYLKLEQAKIPLQDAYGQKICTYLRDTEKQKILSQEELKNVRRAFLSCADVAEWAQRRDPNSDPD